MLKRWQRSLLVLIVLFGAAVGGATLAPAQSFIEFPTPTANSNPQGITTGPDGALWFTELNDNIGRITTAGVITEFPPSPPAFPLGITTGPDGALWFTDQAGSIGRITTAGVITEFPLPPNPPLYMNKGPIGITTGPDGALWFTECTATHIGSCLNSNIGRITTAGVITEFPIGNVSSGITTGPDGALWFTEHGSPSNIGRITTAGVITEFPLPSILTSDNPWGITTGPDGAVWFTDSYGNYIGRITTAGVITEYPLPTGSSYPYAITTAPDGALWFTEQGCCMGMNPSKIGRITTAGVITEFPIAAANNNGNTGPTGITTRPDGALWLTETGEGYTTTPSRIGRFSLPTLQASPATGLAPLAVTFVTQVQSPDISGGYKVDFGDGITSPMGISPSGIACTVNLPCYTGIGTTSHTYVSDGTYTATLLNAASIGVATVPIVVSGNVFSLPIMSPHAAAPPSITQRIVVGGTNDSPPAIASFAATPASIAQGSGATLAWSVSGATSLSISGIGEVNGTSIQVSPTQTTNYTLTANNGQRSATAQTTVTVSWYRWRRIDPPSP